MIKKPDWLRIPYFDEKSSDLISGVLDDLSLNTVCIEANCPNRGECFSNKTATFMILGTNCTRKCTFCNVKYGEPEPVDLHEAERIALAVEKLNLNYVVITSVTRDDLPDGGAQHFSNVITAIKISNPETRVEVLIPDLNELKVITVSSPDVISHNIETVKSLYNDVRPGADYIRSLNVLQNIKQLEPEIYTKSGIMLGLGESREEVLKAFDDLLTVGCDFLTIGQYLAPTKAHYSVKEYIHPSVFEEYKKIADNMGFRYVSSSPFVRSSYMAGNALIL